MNELGLYVFLATAFESMAEYVYSLRAWKKSIPAYIALILAIATAWTVPQLDIIKALGFEFPYTWITIIITGFALARGANFIHDIFNWVRAWKELAQNGTAAAKEVAKPIDGQ